MRQGTEGRRMSEKERDRPREVISGKRTETETHNVIKTCAASIAELTSQVNNIKGHTCIM